MTRCTLYNFYVVKFVCLVSGLWFSPVTLVSSTNKTDHHDITERLLKMALSTITLTHTCIKMWHKNHVMYSHIVVVCFSLILDNERWKQTDVPAEFQELVDHITKSGIKMSYC